MSLTEKAYEERKWQGLKRLADLMSGLRLDDKHYPISTAGYSVRDHMTDLFTIALIIIDNKSLLENVDVELRSDIDRELYTLSEMLENFSHHFSYLLIAILEIKLLSVSVADAFWLFYFFSRLLDYIIF
jgi:hypothetical protein